MFDQSKYINEYIKSNYRCFKVRVRNDDKIMINHLKNISNVNEYIKKLILNDIYENRKTNFINDEIKIDFDLSVTLNDLIKKAEEADILNDYGLYMNIVYAIDSQAKKEVSQHIITENQWNNLMKRYCL